ncbi:hypothetical protein ACFO9Q_20770 [Paenibacillus sp. GCM10023252]|uniref:hypothetical protein n=1 Tax=Paenibacillus sp. GCM10023252 TaxID=3252649 RepID=UPI00360E16E2
MSRDHHHCCPKIDPIVLDPITVYRDRCVKQFVDVIQPIRVVDRVHCIPVHRKFFCYVDDNNNSVGGAMDNRSGGRHGSHGSHGGHGSVSGRSTKRASVSKKNKKKR